MKINVLSGSNQIGGNCVEILGEKSRIVLDIGVPLTDCEANPLEINITKDMVKKYLPEIADLYLDVPQKKDFSFNFACASGSFWACAVCE